MKDTLPGFKYLLPLIYMRICTCNISGCTLCWNSASPNQTLNTIYRSPYQFEWNELTFSDRKFHIRVPSPFRLPDDKTLNTADQARMTADRLMYVPSFPIKTATSCSALWDFNEKSMLSDRLYWSVESLYVSTHYIIDFLYFWVIWSQEFHLYKCLI